MSDLWIVGGTIITMDKSRNIFSDANIHIQDDKIIAIEKNDGSSHVSSKENVIEANGQIVLPGFINAHTHADCIMARGGISQDQSLFEWLVHITDPIRQAFTEEELRVAIELYCHEAIRSGITYLADLVGFVEDWRHAAVLETYEQMGLRVAYAPMFVDQTQNRIKEIFDSSKKAGSAMPPVETSDGIMKRIKHFLDYDHMRGQGRIKVWVAPRLGRATTPKGLLKSVELARDYDTRTTTHCAETQAESRGSDISTVSYLESSGYLSDRTVLAHCVWVNEVDIRKLADTGTKVAHCSSTNLFLGSGVAPVSKMIDAGVQVALGTDNANANNLVSMWTEMRNAALLQKGVNASASAVTAEEALEMATIQGARVVGEEANLGSIEVGKQADLIILDKGHTNMVPSYHIPSVLVYQSMGMEVSTTIVAGKVLMRDRKLSCCPPEKEKEFLDLAQEKAEEVTRRAKLDTQRSQSWVSRIKP